MTSLVESNQSHGSCRDHVHNCFQSQNVSVAGALLTLRKLSGRSRIFRLTFEGLRPTLRPFQVVFHTGGWCPGGTSSGITHHLSKASYTTAAFSLYDQFLGGRREEKRF
jgi:hypothetical protein